MPMALDIMQGAAQAAIMKGTPTKKSPMTSTALYEAQPLTPSGPDILRGTNLYKGKQGYGLVAARA